MITLIHGEDSAASRNYYWNLKQKTPDALTAYGPTISLTDLQQMLAGQDLFGTKKTVFLEDLFSKKKNQKEIEQFADVLHAADADIILWESKELTAKQSGLLQGATIKVFKIPATIFVLLDSVKPGNGKALIQQFHKTMEEKDPEFVLVMLQRQIRILLALSSSLHVIPAKTEIQESGPLIRSGMTISETSRLAPWQKGKLEKQAKLFSQSKLLQLHNQLFELELHMKTGGLALPLAESIDVLLLSV